MKKLLCCILSMVMLVFSFTACEMPNSGNSNSTTKQENAIEFVQSELNLVIGESVQAEVTSMNKNIFIFWSIRDTNIATVNTKGVITAVAAGETVCYAEFGGQTAMCLVKVTEPGATQELSVFVPYQNNTVSLYTGGSIGLNPVVKMGEETITDAAVEYVVEDAQIASVADGKLVAGVVGSTTIAINVSYNGQTATTLVTVQVIEMVKDIKSFTFSGQKTTFTFGDKFVFDGVVDVEYVDGTTESDVKYYTVDYSNYNATKLGTYEITIIMDDMQQTYSVTVVKGKTLKLLMIGNSFSQDTVNWLPQIAKNVGFTDIVIGNLVIGGCTISTHYANSQSNAANYEFTYYKNGAWTDGTTGLKRTMQYGIEYANWDFISLQQQSGNSGNVSSYNHELLGLIEYVKSKATNSNMKLVWNMTWAYPGESNWFGGLYSNDQMIMYNSICSAVQEKILTNDDFCTFSPAGTAIQNARTSFFGDSMGNETYVKDVLNRDGAHLSVNEGRFISSLSMFCTLTGYMPNEITYHPEEVDEKEFAVIIESVTNALTNPFSVTNSQYKTK